MKVTFRRSGIARQEEKKKRREEKRREEKRREEKRREEKRREEKRREEKKRRFPQGLKPAFSWLPMSELKLRPPNGHLIGILLVMIVAVRVSIVIFVPTVIVFKPAAISVPVAIIELLSIVMRCHPMGARIRRAGPIALVPPVMSTDRIPVSVDPNVIWAGTHGPRVNNPRRRWRTDSNAEGDLGVRCRCAHR